MIKNREISIIVAVGNNQEIGLNNKLLWKISADLKRFKQLTTENTVIMGRKTFESLPNGALPNRDNIIVSSSKNLTYKNCIVANSLEEAIEKCSADKTIFIIGGEQIYKDSIHFADYIYLTKVYENFKADAYFPKINFSEWNVLESERIEKSEKNEFFHEYFKLKRK
jgi:dihydrofolate reductase